MNLPTICLLLTPADNADAQSVRSQLAARQWHVSTVHDPYRAIAELALRERAQAARLGWGLGRGQRMALVIHTSAVWRDADRLIAAVRRHLPGVEIWQAVQDELQPVHVSEAEELEDNQRSASGAGAIAPVSPQHPQPPLDRHRPAARPAVSVIRRQASPDLRLTDDPKPASPQRNTADHADEQSMRDEQESADVPRSTTLTADEIEMLLADSPGDSQDS